MQRLAIKINASNHFSILLDETTDISGIEQLSVCARYIEPDTCTVQEAFLQFVPQYDFTGKGIAMATIESLESVGVDITKMRGQGYNGAALMGGYFNRV